MNTDGLLPQVLPDHPKKKGHNPHIMAYPYFYSKDGTRPKEDSRRPVTHPMPIEGKGQELQRYSRRSPTPTPSHDDRWTKSGWQDWSTKSWKETQGESEQGQYAAQSTSRGSNWQPTP
eukprot:631077-Amphidinium_carterae.1